MAKISLILGLCLASSLAFAQNFTAHTEECREDLNFTSSVFQTAFNNLRGFDYVNHALQTAAKEVADPVYCIASVTLSKNEYQYFRFYIQVNIHSRYSLVNRYSFRFLMQDASTQAFQNTGGQPWVAIPLRDADAALDDIIDRANFKSVTAPTIGLTVLQAAMQSFTWQSNVGNMDTSTISILRLVTQKYDFLKNPVYLVSWMTKTSAANPFAVPVSSKSLLLTQKSSGEWVMDDSLSTYNSLLTPLDTVLQANAAGPRDVTAWSDLLLRISRP